jgi:hypothetical protein
MSYLDGRKAMKNLMLLWNPMLDHYKTSHVSLRRTFHLLTRVRHKQAIFYTHTHTHTQHTLNRVGDSLFPTHKILCITTVIYSDSLPCLFFFNFFFFFIFLQNYFFSTFLFFLIFSFIFFLKLFLLILPFKY